MEDTILIYSRQAADLRQVVAECPADCLGWKQGEESWSVLEIAGHLADAELLASMRIRRIITQDRPRFSGYDQEAWARSLGYRNRKIEEVVRRFSVLRDSNAELLGEIGDDVWNRTGHHDDYGAMSLRQWIEDYVAHTAKHLDQIRHIADSVKSKGLPNA